MPTVEIIKPVIKPSKNPSEVNINHRFMTGPERSIKIISVDGVEYVEIISRVLQDATLIDGIISTWRNYASILAKQGKDAEPPIGDYHRRLMLACDPKDDNRAATLSTIFGEKIESDALYEYIEKNSPSWAAEFSIQKEEG